MAWRFHNISGTGNSVLATRVEQKKSSGRVTFLVTNGPVKAYHSVYKSRRGILSGPGLFEVTGRERGGGAGRIPNSVCIKFTSNKEKLITQLCGF